MPNQPGVGPVTPPGGPTTGNPSNPNPPSTPGGTPGSGNGQLVISSPDALKKDAIDRPVGTIEVRLPGSTGYGGGYGPGSGIPPGTGGLPPGETPPGTPPPEEPPTFYGEPVEGKFVFILDASGSMAGSRIASLRAECTSTINGLAETDEFDCMSYGTQFSDSTMELWGGLMPATSGNKQHAINFVNGPACNPGAGTPTYRALQKACSMYPEDLSKMLLLTDGSPNATGSASKILQDFPGWWSKFSDDTVFVGICIGGVEGAVSFMRDLCAIANGIFINKP